MKPGKAARQSIELGPGLSELMGQALAQSPMVAAALAGFVEGRGLIGRFRLEITGARLIELAPAPAPNGKVSEAAGPGV